MIYLKHSKTSSRDKHFMCDIPKGYIIHCEKCKEDFPVTYVYPDGDVVLSCNHIVKQDIVQEIFSKKAIL